MFKILKSNKAQITAAEYLLVLGVVVSAAVAMTVYFRRAVQARIWSAEHTMIATAINRTGNTYSGNWVVQYEPYYSNTVSTVTRDDIIREQLNATTFSKTFNTFVSVETQSDTASPRYYLDNLPSPSQFLTTANTYIPLP